MPPLRSHPWIRAWAVAFVLMATGLIAVVFSGSAQAHSSTITALSGQVLMRHGSAPYVPVQDGDVVGAGDSVRTAAASYGVLTLFDGTTIELEPDTEVSIDTLIATAGGDKVVEITQVLGRTWNVVTHLASPNSRYEIKTPAATAAVRGTAFEVVVFADGSTNTATTEGDVATSAGGDQVHVLAGQATSVTRGSAPRPARAATAPSTVVKVTMDRTQNAVVTDANGRSVGVQNGTPLRYVPGSTVEVVDGKLVITIPNAPAGLLGTLVRPDPPSPGGQGPDSIAIRTQIIAAGLGIVADTLAASPVRDGTAKGAVVVTDGGLLPAPDGDLRNAPAPRIGALPPGPTGFLPVVSVRTTAPLVAVASARPSVAATPTADPATAATPVPTTSIVAPATPTPSSGGFVPSTVGLVPVLLTPPPTPTPAPTVQRTRDPIIASPTPTPAPILKTIDPIVVPTATPAATLTATPTETASPAPTPTSAQPTSTPALTRSPTATPTSTESPTPAPAPTPTESPTPTPAPTQAPLICLPLVGCL